MKTLKAINSLQVFLIVSLLFAFSIGLQLIYNQQLQEQPFLIGVFSVFVVFFICLAVLITLDLIYKDKTVLAGEIVSIRSTFIEFKMPNGKKKKYRVPSRHILQKLKVGYQIELVVTKRTKFANRLRIITTNEEVVL